MAVFIKNPNPKPPSESEFEFIERSIKSMKEEEKREEELRNDGKKVVAKLSAKTCEMISMELTRLKKMTPAALMVEFRKKIEEDGFKHVFIPSALETIEHFFDATMPPVIDAGKIAEINEEKEVVNGKAWYDLSGQTIYYMTPGYYCEKTCGLTYKIGVYRDSYGIDIDGNAIRSDDPYLDTNGCNRFAGEASMIQALRKKIGKYDLPHVLHYLTRCGPGRYTSNICNDKEFSELRSAEGNVFPDLLVEKDGELNLYPIRGFTKAGKPIFLPAKCYAPDGSPIFFRSGKEMASCAFKSD